MMKIKRVVGYFAYLLGGFYLLALFGIISNSVRQPNSLVSSSFLSELIGFMLIVLLIIGFFKTGRTWTKTKKDTVKVDDIEKRKSVQKIVPVALYGLSVLALLGIVRILILMNDDSRLITAFIPGIVFCTVLFSFFFIKARKYGKKDHQKFLAQMAGKELEKRHLGICCSQ